MQHHRALEQDLSAEEIKRGRALARTLQP